MSDEIPGKEIRWPSSYTLKNARVAPSIPINTTMIDEHYLSTLGMHLLAGRNFSVQFKTDSKGLILTKSASKLLGFPRPEDAIGKEFRSDDGDYAVVGVVNDFYQLSLQKKQTPAAFQFNRGDLREFEYYLVKLKTAQVRQTVDRIQSAWSANFKGNPFSFSFLDEYFNRQYQGEIRFGIFFGIFSLLAVVIACIGLFALVAFMIKQRTREIGVRKVLGAGLQDVLLLLTKDFISLVLVANLIAWPVGWLLMNHWVEDFANRIHISWLVFVLAGLTALLIALITISFQAVRAALANPVKSLRTE
jgi:putative ABC transport system permease protein